MAADFSETTWLAWLVKLRIVIISFLLGIELLIVRLTKTMVDERTFISVIVLWYTFAVFFAVLFAIWTDTRLQSRLQILADLILATAVIYITGGIDTSFNFLYPLIIIVASILLPRWWAYLTAALSFIGFGLVLELPLFFQIPSYSSTKPDLPSLTLVILINLCAYLAIAYLASNLSAKLRQADVELQDKSGELQNLQALHENVIHSMRGGLITTNLEGRVTLLNPAGQKLLERSAQDVQGVLVSELFIDRLPDVESSALHGEVRCRSAAGGEKTFGISVSSLRAPDGTVNGYVYVFDDLTEIRRLEREVRMRDRLAAVGRMAAGIAHEIRNPLSSIAGSVHVLSETSELKEEQRALLDIVTRESQRLNSIISDFLLYSRDKSYKFTTVDLCAILDETLLLLENRPMSSDQRIQIIRNFQTQTAFAGIDRDRMKQVFWNICENSMKAMPQGGRLTVSLSPQGKEWRISFRDTGHGLNPQEAEKIFEPFQSRFEGGTGLGLALVYQILQAHDAKIFVNSALGQGAEFVIEIKKADEAEKWKEQVATHAVAGGIRV